MGALYTIQTIIHYHHKHHHQIGRPSLLDVGRDKLPDYKKKGGDGARPLFPSFYIGFPNKLVSLFMIIVLLNQKWDNQGGSHLYIHISDLHLI